MAAWKEAYTLLALAPLSGERTAPSKPRTIRVDPEEPDRAVEHLAPSLAIPVSEHLCRDGALAFRASGMRSFTPQGVLDACPYLARLSEASSFVDEENRRGTPDDRIAPVVRERWPDLPPDLLTVARAPAREKPAEGGVVDDILGMVAVPEATGGGTLKARMDGLMARLLGVVFGHEAFRTLEASWRGVEALLRQGRLRPEGGVFLDLVPVTADSLNETLEALKAPLASSPPNLVLVDLPFESSPPHLARLEQAATLGSDLLVPTAAWAHARFFHIPSWSRLQTLPYLEHHLEDAAYAKWRRLASHPGGPWTVLLVNRFLGRPAYGENNPPRTAFFKEEGDLWIAPVWAFGALAVQSVHRWGWPTRMTDATQCRLEDLTVDPAREGGPASTEVLLSEDRAAEFIRSGFTPLAGARGRDTAFIPRESSVSGGPVAPQAFLNRLLGDLFRLRESLSDAGEPPSEAALGEFLSSRFRETGHEPPEDLSVRVKSGASDKPPRVRISLTPPASLLRSPRPVALDWTW